MYTLYIIFSPENSSLCFHCSLKALALHPLLQFPPVQHHTAKQSWYHIACSLDQGNGRREKWKDFPKIAKSHCRSAGKKQTNKQTTKTNTTQTKSKTNRQTKKQQSKKKEVSGALILWSRAGITHGMPALRWQIWCWGTGSRAVLRWKLVGDQVPSRSESREASQRGLLRRALPAHPRTPWHAARGGTPQELLPSPICGPMLPVLSFQLWGLIPGLAVLAPGLRFWKGAWRGRNIGHPVAGKSQWLRDTVLLPCAFPKLQSTLAGVTLFYTSLE